MSESESGKELGPALGEASRESDQQLEDAKLAAETRRDTTEAGQAPAAKEGKDKRSKGEGGKGKPTKQGERPSKPQAEKEKAADKAPATAQSIATKPAAGGSKSSQPHAPPPLPVYRLAMFDHLSRPALALTSEQSSHLHPSTIKLGMLFRKGQLYDDDDRVSALLLCLMNVIEDYSSPPNKSFSWDLDRHIKHQVRKTYSIITMINIIFYR